MPRDMLREMWLGLKRSWGLRWSAKGPILAGLAALIVVAVFALRAGGATEAESAFRKGNELSQEERWEQAIAEYDRAIALDPELADAYLRRGIAYGNLVQHERAVVDFNRAIEVNPSDAAAWYYRGWSNLNLGKYQQAIADADKSIGIQADAPDPYYNRGMARSALGDSQGAIADLETAFSLSGNSEEWRQKAIEDLGKLISRNGEPAVRARMEKVLAELRGR